MNEWVDLVHITRLVHIYCKQLVFHENETTFRNLFLDFCLGVLSGLHLLWHLIDGFPFFFFTLPTCAKKTSTNGMYSIFL